MTANSLVLIGKLIIDIIGFFYVYKTIMSYIKHGAIADPTKMKERSYYVCLFALCFLGGCLIQYLITKSGFQLFCAVIHSTSLIVNYNLYLKYKSLE